MCDLGGKPMIDHVVDMCVQTGLRTVVLTDDIRIHKHVSDKCMVFMDPSDYQNGTERCAGAIKDDWLDGYDQFINVQGDMPDVTVEMIERVKSTIPQSGVATAWTEMKESLQSDPNTVKLVHNNVFAHWFGRGMTYGSQHLGIYGYTRKALSRYPLYNQSQHEDIEKLEQLRWIDNNWRIAVTRVDFDGIEINTPDDAERWNMKNEG
tara:strand:- start:198 stop:818 length:621 start_codon:yes stop_codon:yes gene_type:complete